jgi:YggT family protein
MIRQTIIILLYLMQFLIIVRIFMSWLPTDQRTTFIRYLHMATEPVLSPVRKLLERTPVNRGMFDFSPFIVILVINLVIRILS